MNINDEEFMMLEEVVSSIYNRGIKDGMEDSEKRYKQGLNDAWECARKIILSCGEGGYDAGTIEDIFGMSYHDVLKECKPNKAIELIKEYEERQKQDANDMGGGNIKVGDEVRIKGNDPIKVEIPKNATNGDVLLALYPHEDLLIGSEKFGTNHNEIGGMRVLKEWWNASWKGQEE